MNIQEKEGLNYENEMNLYDYWKVIVKRKKLIIGLFLVSIAVAAIVSLLMPKVYRGEAILRMTVTEVKAAKDVMTAKDVIDIIGKPERERKSVIFAKNHDSISDLKLAVKETSDRMKVTIESEKPDLISPAFIELAEYINNIPVLKQYVQREQEALRQQEQQEAELEKQEEKREQLQEKKFRVLLAELPGVIDRSKKFKDDYSQAYGYDNFKDIDISPITIEQQIFGFEKEKLNIEQELQLIKQNQLKRKYLRQKRLTRPELQILTQQHLVDLVDKPFISSNPIRPNIKKNIIVVSSISLFLGIFLAFFMEYLERIKNQV